MRDQSVRLATSTDADVLARLRYEFRAAHGTATESRVTFMSRCREWMQRRLHNDAAWRCWVVEQQGVITGHVWVQLIEKIPNPVREAEVHAYLTNLYVQPSARGGAGTRLLEAALAWCREQAVDAVILWPTEKSRSLYARLGFVPGDGVMTYDAGGGT